MAVTVSLFSGCGGLDLGAESAGAEVQAALEIDDDAADSLEKNFRHLAGPVVRQDILEVATDHLLAPLRSDPDLLIGGPPCTPFSKSGMWLEWKRDGLDPDASLLDEYVRILREAQPRAFILENVRALTFNNKQSRPSFERLLRGIRKAGYDCRFDVLNAADFGVPQNRQRLFVVGSRRGTPVPELPLPTHFGMVERSHSGGGDTPHTTAGEALRRVRSEPESGELMTGKWADLLPGIPPGNNYLWYTERGGGDPLFKWRSRYWNFLLKLSPEAPSPTIQAQPGPNVGPFHWENRRLRVPEVKALFGFPPSFEICGTRRAAQAQLGNSVPPPLAAAVTASVLQSL